MLGVESRPSVIVAVPRRMFSTEREHPAAPVPAHSTPHLLEISNARTRLRGATLSRVPAKHLVGRIRVRVRIWIWIWEIGVLRRPT